MTLKIALGLTALSLLMPCVLFCLLAGCKTNPPTAAKLQRLQGYWKGELLGGSFKCSMTITGNSLLFYSRTDFWYKATFTLPAGTDPQQLSGTIKDTAPSATNDIGKVIVAIFKIEHGTLTLAVNQDPAGPPPKAFPTETNTVIARYDLKKVQPQKKRAEASTLSETGQPVFHPGGMPEGSRSSFRPFLGTTTGVRWRRGLVPSSVLPIIDY